MSRPVGYIYKNLRAEMARQGICGKDLAPVLGLNRATVSSKLNGKYALTLDEAMAIKTNFFPEMALEYLFERGED